MVVLDVGSMSAVEKRLQLLEKCALNVFEKTKQARCSWNADKALGQLKALLKSNWISHWRSLQRYHEYGVTLLQADLFTGDASIITLVKKGPESGPQRQVNKKAVHRGTRGCMSVAVAAQWN